MKKVPLNERPTHPNKKIIHTMADGTVLEDLSQYKVNPDTFPPVAKQIIANIYYENYENKVTAKHSGNKWPECLAAIVFLIIWVISKSQVRPFLKI